MRRTVLAMLVLSMVLACDAGCRRRKKGDRGRRRTEGESAWRLVPEAGDTRAKARAKAEANAAGPVEGEASSAAKRPAPEGDGDNEPDGNAADPTPAPGATPKEVAKAFNVAAREGDVARALELTHAPAREHRDMVEALVRSAAAMQRLRGAVAKRFGAEAEAELDFGLHGDEEFDAAGEHVKGDRAVVVLPGWKEAADVESLGPEGATRLVRAEDGRWLLDAGWLAAQAGDASYATMMSLIFERAADLTAADVRAGKYAAPEDAAGAFRNRPFEDLEAFKDLLPAEMQAPADGGGGGDPNQE